MIDEIVLSGMFRFLTLGEVLQILGTNGSTGVLEVASDHASGTSRVFFSMGDPIHATCLSDQGIDALYSLFGWTDGRFGFRDMETTCERTIHKGIMDIIMTGSQMLDEGKIKVLGSGDASRMMSAGLQRAVTYNADSVPLIERSFGQLNYLVGEEFFESGRKIYNRTRSIPWMYILLEGSVNVFRETWGGRIPVCRLGPGTYLGDLPNFKSRDERAVSVVADEDVTVGVFSPGILKSQFSKISIPMRSIFQSLTHRWVEVTDRLVETRGNNAELREHIMEGSSYIEQGGEPSVPALIHRGTAWIVHNSEDGSIPLVQLGPGDFVGSIPFLKIGHEPGDASVITQNLDTKSLDAEKILAEFQRISPLVSNFCQYVANCVTETTRFVCALGPPDL